MKRAGVTALVLAAATPLIAAPPAPKPAPKSAPPQLPGRPILPRPGADFFLAGEPRQGAVLLGRAPNGTRALSFNGAPLAFAADGQFLVGFDRDAPTAASLRAVLADGRVIDRPLAIRPGNWRIEQIDASPTGEAATTDEFKARRGVELARINAARRMQVFSDGWRQKFVWPVKARISGWFGSQRVYRGQPGSYHSGLDLAGGAGTKFVAPADGVVILAASEPFTLEGRLLMVDHGMGLNSAFLHCSQLFVREGDVVKQGQILGAIGATGRATGPHLHWGMKWGNARVDPLLLVGG